MYIDKEPEICIPYYKPTQVNILPYVYAHLWILSLGALIMHLSIYGANKVVA